MTMHPASGIGRKAGIPETAAVRVALHALACLSLVLGATVPLGASSPIPAGFDQVSVLGTDSVLLEKDSAVGSGDVVGNSTDALVTISMNATTAALYAVRSDVIDLKNGVTPQGSYFCNTLDSHPSVSASCSPQGIPVFATLPDFEAAAANANDQSVANNASATLAPGAYGALDVGKDATLTLGPGTYDFASIETGNGASILFDGPTIVRVAGQVFTGHDNVIGPAASPSTPVTAADIVFFVSGADGDEDAVHFGRDTTVDGNVYAPNGTVRLKGVGSGSPSTTLNGAILAQHVVLEGGTTVNLETNFRNLPPVAVSDAIVVPEGGATSTLVGGATSVLANDSDPNNDNLFATTTLIDVPDFGAAVLAADGTFTYTHNGTENFIDSFVYEVCDDGVAPGPLCSTATVAITITPVNDAPVAMDDTFTVDEGTSGSSASVLDNDSDADDLAADLTVTLFGSGPSNGSLTLDAVGTFTYGHDGSETLSDSFQYQVCDDGTDPPGVLCDTATVTITVNPINDKPVANDDTFTVDEGGSGSSGVLGNDTDDDDLASALTVTLDGPAPDFAASFNLAADGTFTYEHDGTETFSTSFDYEVCDDGTDPPGVLCDTATVAITINPVNDAPVAVPDTFTVDEGGTATALDSTELSVLANDTDAENDGLTATLLGAGPTNGTLALNGDGTFSYTHDGSETTSDSFAYEVCDDGTPQECDDTTVSIIVNPVNDDPIGDDQTITVGLPTTITMTGSDAEGDALTFSILTAPPASEGTLGPVTPINATSASVQFTPGARGDGDAFDTGFVFQVADGNGGFGTGNVTITVLGTNSPPVTRSDAIRVNNGSTATTLINGATSLLANDFDPDGDGLTLQAAPVSGPSNGSVTLNPNGTFSYTHNGSATTTDAFVYQVCDDGSPSLCSNGQVNVQVLAGSITVTLTFLGDGGGTVTSSPAGLSCTETTATCAATITSPNRIDLAATPASGSAFAGFGGDPDCSDGSLLVDTDKNCTVTFNDLPDPPVGEFTLVVSKTGSGDGTIVSDPAGITCGSDCEGTYPALTRVRLNAIPEPGSEFVSWNGDVDCEDGILIRLPGDAVSCVAIFDAVPVPPSTNTLTVVVSGEGTVSSSPSGINCSSNQTCSEDFGTGEVVTLFARARGSFVGWSGACVGSSPITNVTVDVAKTCTATFSP